MATAYVFKIDGYEFPRDEVPARGPIVEEAPQNWSEQDVLGAGAPGTIMTFLGYKSQRWDFTSMASATTVNKLKAIHASRAEVTFITPQNTTGFKVVMPRLFVPHEEPEAGGKFLCRFTLVSRAPVSSDVPAEEDDDVPTIVVKTADQTVTNSQVQVNDTELLLAIGSNETWIFEFHILLAIKAASDWKFQIDVPAGAAGAPTLQGDADQTAGYESIHIKLTYGLATGFVKSGIDDANSAATITGIVLNGGTAGNVLLKWAQNVAIAEDTVVKAHSYLVAWKT